MLAGGLGMMAGVAAVAGCVAAADDRTGGLAFRYERREDPVGLAVWTLETDGILRFSGGRDAVLGQETWRGPLSAGDLDRLRSLAADLVAATPASDAGDPGDPGDPAAVRTRLELRTAAGRVRIRRDGDPPVLEAMLQILRDASAARLQPTLERLPRPTEPAPGGAGP